MSTGKQTKGTRGRGETGLTQEGKLDGGRKGMLEQKNRNRQLEKVPAQSAKSNVRMVKKQ